MLSPERYNILREAFNDAKLAKLQILDNIIPTPKNSEAKHLNP